MYADPQTLTINAVATTFNRVGSPQPDKKGVFRTIDDLQEFVVSQNVSSNRFRREVRLNQTKIAADPISTLNKEVSTSIVLVVDEPRIGFSNAELVIQLTALLTWATVAANRDKLLGGEL
jgi:hypothetical protein